MIGRYGSGHEWLAIAVSCDEAYELLLSIRPSPLLRRHALL